MKFILFLIIIIANFNIYAENYFCNDQLETLPILQNGRIKPLYVHANESIKVLTTKTKVDQYSAVVAYCLLSSKKMGLPTEINFKARIDHIDLQKFLGLAPSEHEIDYDKLVVMFDQIKLEARTIKDNDSYKKAASKLLDSIMLYLEILNGENWMFYDEQNIATKWSPLSQYFTEEKVVAQKNLTPDDPFTPVFKKSESDFILKNGNKYLIELYYAKLNLVSFSLLFTILALTTFTLSKNFKFTLIFAGLSTITQLTLIIFRIIISGRAPITNMYETVMFSGFIALFLSMALGHLKKENIFVYMGLSFNLCTLMMLSFANGMLTATIGPLVPVLRDNFWLSTHVTTVISSYGALALSWILANTILIRRTLNKIDQNEEKRLEEVVYTTLKWGTIMLGAGIILGGVWADYSWGRFWGWDPKETWSLIVLCIYMAILHGRHTSWIKRNNFITITALAFLSVMMAWFGVNYILATGLHSYGFSEGGAIFLGSFFIIQIAFVTFTQLNKKST